MHGRDGGEVAGTGIRLRSSSCGRSGAYAPAPDSDRHASWLDLGRYLHGHLTAGFLFLFVPVWRVWMSFSYHADVFGKDKPSDRAATVVARPPSFELRHPSRVAKGLHG